MKHEKCTHTIGSERGVESQPTFLKKTQLLFLKQSSGNSWATQKNKAQFVGFRKRLQNEKIFNSLHSYLNGQ